jgi:hypothetical protein
MMGFIQRRGQGEVNQAGCSAGGRARSTKLGACVSRSEVEMINSPERKAAARMPES